MRRLRPDIIFGADLIAGFPTETEEHFQNTLHLLRSAGSPTRRCSGSPRKGTPAARMPQVSRSEVKERAARLVASQQDARPLSRWAAGALVDVLTERPVTGRTAQFTGSNFH